MWIKTCGKVSLPNVYANVHEQSEMGSCKLKTLLKWFDKLASCLRGNFDGIFVGMLFMSGTNKLKATHSASYKHLKPFETLGCSGYLQVWKRYNENWTGYAGQHFLHLMPMGYLRLSKASNLGVNRQIWPNLNLSEISGAQGRVILIKSGRNLNSFEVLCLSRFPASLMTVQSKMN